LQTARQVPIVGYMIDGGKVLQSHTLHGQAPQPTITLFDESDTVKAITITTERMFPAYRSGDVVFYRAPDMSRIGIASLDRVECVCKFADDDDEMMVAQIQIQQDGSVTLNSYANDRPIVNAKLEWASPVLWVKRHIPHHLSNI
jgi:phage repressor protein C with HTH and peptisase S24 domain